MKLFKPKFWGTKTNFYSIILLPISWIFLIVIYINKKIKFSKKFKIPVICVGNIYLGGTGKTPLSIYIHDALKDKQKKSAIIKKYYKNHRDEHELIYQKTKSLILNKKRGKALEEAETEGYTIAILDDGFQDYSIKKDLNILCFHERQLIGNGFIFPAGPLRESMNSIKDVQIVLINGKKDEFFEKKLLSINKDIKIYYSKYQPLNTEKFKNKKFLAIAGIGNPDNFFRTLINNDLNVKETMAFPDHYEFSEIELKKIIDKAKKKGLELITTEKDFFRIKKYKLDDINYLQVGLEIQQRENFLKQIFNYL